MISTAVTRREVRGLLNARLAGAETAAERCRARVNAATPATLTAATVALSYAQGYADGLRHALDTLDGTPEDQRGV